MCVSYLGLCVSPFRLLPPFSPFSPSFSLYHPPPFSYPSFPLSPPFPSFPTPSSLTPPPISFPLVVVCVCVCFFLRTSSLSPPFLVLYPSFDLSFFFPRKIPLPPIARLFLTIYVSSSSQIASIIQLLFILISFPFLSSRSSSFTFPHCQPSINYTHTLSNKVAPLLSLTLTSYFRSLSSLIRSFTYNTTRVNSES
ncbi:hypothetical protein BKA57DRAFT_160504 [Linnemannia elongata]|nr:hypothetical protein BKA57DRAFT_160504 [Linnemannia elongata]